MRLTDEEIYRLALEDAETESLDNLKAAAEMWDKLNSDEREKGKVDEHRAEPEA